MQTFDPTHNCLQLEDKRVPFSLPNTSNFIPWEGGTTMKWNIESGTISASFGNGPLNRTNISDSWIRVCVFNRILHESCSRAETNILNNTGKLKSDIYRRGEKWMDFPVENPRWILDTQCRSGYLDTGWYPALFGNRSDFQKEP